MNLLERLESDMIKAAKARDSERLGAIRFVRSRTKNRQIELKRELKDEDVVEVLSRIAKQHRESIEQFQEGGRDELVKHERRQLSVVEEYLPAQLGEQELLEILSGVIEETGAAGPRDIGMVMKTIMPRVKGRADGKIVKALVQSRLTDGED
ncbi:MAG: GatB/YqeY domain-containing protein [Candidatus Eisenbacteria sp.]|nr:GatB/YqeY domain-containing protein [Candidatus Eisenbacteria bacterium]